MSERERHTEALSAECEALLAASDMHSLADPKSDEPADLYTIDGDFVATVTRDIEADDLRALLDYGKRQFNAGRDVGVSETQHQMRAALGIKS